ncbi:MAG: tetratricopeptide repeat protein [Alphaproteobacteria bacterium]
MADILREIDEELQRERMLALWEKYKKLVIGLVVALLIATASYSAWKEHTEAAKIKQSGALHEILTSTSRSDKEKLESLQGFLTQFPNAKQTIPARLIISNLHARAGDVPQAVSVLENIAQDKSVPGHMQQYAGLMALHLQLDTGEASALHKKLEPFMAAGAPWRHTAVAMRGALFAKSGDLEQARQYFTALADDKETPTKLQEYARDMANYYATKR